MIRRLTSSYGQSQDLTTPIGRQWTPRLILASKTTARVYAVAQKIDRDAVLRDRRRGQSLRQIAKDHRVLTATVQHVLKDQVGAPKPSQSQPSTGVTKALEKPAASPQQNTLPDLTNPAASKRIDCGTKAVMSSLLFVSAILFAG